MKPKRPLCAAGADVWVLVACWHGMLCVEQTSESRCATVYLWLALSTCACPLRLVIVIIMLKWCQGGMERDVNTGRVYKRKSLFCFCGPWPPICIRVLCVICQTWRGSNAGVCLHKGTVQRTCKRCTVQKQWRRASDLNLRSKFSRACMSWSASKQTWHSLMSLLKIVQNFPAGNHFQCCRKLNFAQLPFQALLQVYATNQRVTDCNTHTWS